MGHRPGGHGPPLAAVDVEHRPLLPHREDVGGGTDRLSAPSFGCHVARRTDRGAGAGESRAGFFQVADGGTIFLDEIGNTSVHMQAKLLRVLQDGEIQMVGSARPRHVDIRVVAATNKNLDALIKNELFREDLFFRLNVITVGDCHAPRSVLAATRQGYQVGVAL